MASTVDDPAELTGPRRSPRTADPADARTKRLTLTKAGAALAPRAVEVVERVDAEFFAPVSTVHAVELLEQLGRKE